MRRMTDSLGTFVLAAENDLLVRVFFSEPDGDFLLHARFVEQGSNVVLDMAILQLQLFFSKKRKSFTVPLHADGTDFQRKVWERISIIPFGHTKSYAEIASELGSAKKARAVGMAAGANPLPLFIPCHRVIGSDGTLTGFGGGVDRKRQLLAFEGVNIEN